MQTGFINSVTLWIEVGEVEGRKIFIKTVEPVKHEIAPSFFPSHRGKMLLTTPDKKMRD